ncbi:hypothetical protein CEXT_203881 [Caerostris extrusa]|uniref:Uncharacterized protein n=1 Tax=Caerostris extrusa TaxID=172846 RepID=A0AAV4XFV1_CAEEX|nr:hypothetical protein CEXT_203881 [Caerostris extrusa]
MRRKQTSRLPPTSLQLGKTELRQSLAFTCKNTVMSRNLSEELSFFFFTLAEKKKRSFGFACLASRSVGRKTLAFIQTDSVIKATGSAAFEKDLNLNGR